MMDPKSYKHIIILSEQKFENGSSKYTLDQYQEALFMRLKEKFESKYSIFLIQSIFDPGPDFLKQSSVHNSPIHETRKLRDATRSDCSDSMRMLRHAKLRHNLLFMEND